MQRVRVCRDCCCGSRGKHPDVDHDALLARLVELTAGSAVVDASTCLLACERSNVVVVQPDAAGRRAGARPVWLRDVLDLPAVEAIAGWVRAGGPGVREVPAVIAPLVTTPALFPIPTPIPDAPAARQVAVARLAQPDRGGTGQAVP